MRILILASMNFGKMELVLNMNYRNYITIEPNKRGGKPCVRGLRITVYEVLNI
jgi:uncharacterized protein (DUF433 family)